MPEKDIILVKDMHHQCENVVTCATGTSEPFAGEVGLRQGSAFSPFVFAMHDGFTDGKHQRRSTSADDVRR